MMFVVPNLRLNVIDRAVYSHLLRHTRLECRHRLCFTQLWLAKGIGVCRNTARSSLRRLVDRGAVRLIENSLRRPPRRGAAARGDSRRVSRFAPARFALSLAESFVRACAAGRAFDQRTRFLRHTFPALGHLCPRAPLLLLLPPSPEKTHPVPGPRHRPNAFRRQLLSQPRRLLYGVQCAQSPEVRTRLSLPPLPRASPNHQDPRLTPPRPRSPRRRQAPPTYSKDSIQTRLAQIASVVEFVGIFRPAVADVSKILRVET